MYGDWASDAYKSYLEFSFSAKLQLAQRMHLALSSWFLFIAYFFFFSFFFSFGSFLGDFWWSERFMCSI